MNHALRRSSSSTLLLVVVALGACNSVDRFDTKGDAAYCGALVGAPFQEGMLPQQERPRTLNLELKLDAAALAERADNVSLFGQLNSNDAEFGLCAGMSRPLFLASPLRSMPVVDNDPISLMEFGAGRDYNVMAWVDSSCQGTLLAVLSLMRNDNVELRLFKPAAQPVEGAPPAEQPGFGLFYLDRRANGCQW